MSISGLLRELDLMGEVEIELYDRWASAEYWRRHRGDDASVEAECFEDWSEWCERVDAFASFVSLELARRSRMGGDESWRV